MQKLSLETVDQQHFLIWSASSLPGNLQMSLCHDIIMHQCKEVTIVLIFIHSHRVSSPSSLLPLLVLSLMPGDENLFFFSLSSLRVHPFQFSSSVQRKSSHVCVGMRG